MIAYYAFQPIEDVDRAILEERNLLLSLEGRGRIYFSHEGVNAQLSLPEQNEEEYRKEVARRFPSADVKVHTHPSHVFAKLTVKKRKQLVALDVSVDLSDRGEYLTPQEWAEKLSSKSEAMWIIDTRNDYESEIGHFEGADLPKLKTFREFPAYAEQLKEKVDPENTSILMYCTGGIRCELYSSLMKKIGFKKVYHLQGGVIRYGMEKGSDHWRGKLFVFDDRLAVPMGDSAAEPISCCAFCQEKSDRYYNCANMDCNQLFLACDRCVDESKGCCCTACLSGSRVRSFSRQTQTTPFRKLPFAEKMRFME